MIGLSIFSKIAFAHQTKYDDNEKACDEIDIEKFRVPTFWPPDSSPL